jgi:uncharacterized membrane protein YphA (DoxX/SURF4 family)
MKNIFDKKTLNIFSVIIGLLFIVSGIGKAIDVVGFTALISQYGLALFAPLAPVIILFEILLGVSLLFLFNPERDGIISLGMLLIFTSLFAYAHFARNVNDCGCFGAIKNTNFPPLFSFIRNFILIGMSFMVWRYYPTSMGKTITPNWKKYAVVSIMVISLFVTGMTTKSSLLGQSINIMSPETPEMKMNQQDIKNTEFNKYVQTSKDSTYLIFCFSYTCPYCWNSIENLRSFIRNNTVDSVIIFTVGTDSDRLIFEDKFKQDFPVTILSSEAMDKLTTTYPTAYYVENDTIKIVAAGQLSSPFVFEDVLANIHKK